MEKARCAKFFGRKFFGVELVETGEYDDKPTIWKHMSSPTTVQKRVIPIHCVEVLHLADQFIRELVCLYQLDDLRHTYVRFHKTYFRFFYIQYCPDSFLGVKLCHGCVLGWVRDTVWAIEKFPSESPVRSMIIVDVPGEIYRYCSVMYRYLLSSHTLFSLSQVWRKLNLMIWKIQVNPLGPSKHFWKPWKIYQIWVILFPQNNPVTSENYEQRGSTATWFR